MRFPLLPGRPRTAGAAGRSGSGPRKNIPFFRCVLLRETTCACSVAYTWNRPAISQANALTLVFFPRIYKNVYFSGTTIKLTILHKPTSVKGFSCVFSCFCASRRQIFSSFSHQGLCAENPADARFPDPAAGFPAGALSSRPRQVPDRRFSPVSPPKRRPSGGISAPGKGRRGKGRRRPSLDRECRIR